MKLLSLVRSLLRLNKARGAVEVAVKNGYDPWIGLRKGLGSGALELVTVAGAAALVTLLDPAFWGRVLDATELPPEAAAAVLIMLRGLLEMARNWAKQRGVAVDARAKAGPRESRPPSFSAPRQHHGDDQLPPGWVVVRTDYDEGLLPRISHHWGRTPEDARRAAEEA